MDTAYSGTPLLRKLGLKPGFKIKLVAQPIQYDTLLGPLPKGILQPNDNHSLKDFIHVFVSSKAELDDCFFQLAKELKPEGMIWVSWPKKSSGFRSDLDGNIVRQSGIDLGLVDIKVCAVDETWSALKFVIPVKDRQAWGKN